MSHRSERSPIERIGALEEQVRLLEEAFNLIARPKHRLEISAHLFLVHVSDPVLRQK
jgi:hypothetical protein